MRRRPRDAGALLGVRCRSRGQASRMSAAPEPTGLCGAEGPAEACRAWAREYDARARELLRRAQDAPGAAERRERFRGMREEVATWDAGRDAAVNRPFTLGEVAAALETCNTYAHLRGVPMAAVKRAAGVACGRSGDDERPVLRAIAAIANGVLRGAGVPVEHLTLWAKPAFKRGDPAVFSSWRMLTPGTALMWVLARLFDRRLREQLAAARDRVHAGLPAECEAVLDDFQFGFVEGRGCEGALLLTEVVEEDAAARGRLLASVYADASQAFDCVSVPEIGVALWRHGFRGPVWDAVVGMLEGMRVQFRFGDVQLARPVMVRVGSCQGVPFSPMLFNCPYSGLLGVLRGVVGSERAAVSWPRPRGCPLAAASYCGRMFADDLQGTLSVAPGEGAGGAAAASARLQRLVQRYVDGMERGATGMGVGLNVAPAGNKTAVAYGDGVRLNGASGGVWVTNGVGDRVEVPTTEVYKDLGVLRVVGRREVVSRRRRVVVSGTVAHFWEVRAAELGRGMKWKARAARLVDMDPRTARVAYLGYIQPTVTYGLPVVVDLALGVPTPLVEAQVDALRQVVGWRRGHGQCLGRQVLHAVAGVYPLWAVALRRMLVLAVRVLAMHPNHGVRAAHRCVVRAAAGRSGDSWWHRLVVALEDGDRDYRFVVADLLEEEWERGRCVGGGRVGEHVWVTGPRRSAHRRTLRALEARVDELVLRRLRRVVDPGWVREQPRPRRLGVGAGPLRGRGVGYVEARSWLLRSVPGRAMPMLFGPRSEATWLRVAAMGGVALLGDGRNYRLHADGVCLLCRGDGTAGTVAHLVGHCPAVAEARARCWAGAAAAVAGYWRSVEARLGDEGLPPGCAAGVMCEEVVRTAREACGVPGGGAAGAPNASAVQLWTDITLGVPLRAAAEPDWMRGWQCGAHDYGVPAGTEVGVHAVRRHLLDGTAQLVLDALGAFRREAIALSDFGRLQRPAVGGGAGGAAAGGSDGVAAGGP